MSLVNEMQLISFAVEVISFISLLIADDVHTRTGSCCFPSDLSPIGVNLPLLFLLISLEEHLWVFKVKC